MSFTKLPCHAARLAEISSALAKYGLAGWLQGLDYDWIQRRFESPDGTRLAGMSKAQRMRAAMEELGTCFIKLGQILSTRGDLIGPELAEELSLLQAETPADDPDTVRRLVEQELGMPLEEAFTEFEDRCFASASIGQVHHGRLSDGHAVVVKVQHEGIEAKVRQDLEILELLAGLAEEHSTDLCAYRPLHIAEEFRRTMLGELDYGRKLRNLRSFHRNFEGDPSVRIPQPFEDRSSRRVLTMEFLEGTSLTRIDEAGLAEEDLDALARSGFHLFMNMVFRDGLYHADPHPENLLHLGDGVVGLLDCGMVGRLNDAMREDLEDLLIAAASKDTSALTDAVVRLGSIQAGFDRGRLEADLSEFVSEHGTCSVQDLQLSEALMRMTGIIREHRIVLPTQSALLLKMLIQLEGTAKLLSPGFSLAQVLQPFVVRMLERRYAPGNVIGRIKRRGRDWDRLLSMLPRSLSEVLGRVEQGKLEVQLEHRRLDASLDRIVVGMLVSSLILGSCLLWAMQAPPLIGGASLLGVLGFGLGLLLGGRLLWRMRQAASRSH